MPYSGELNDEINYRLIDYDDDFHQAALIGALAVRLQGEGALVFPVDDMDALAPLFEEAERAEDPKGLLKLPPPPRIESAAYRLHFQLFPVADPGDLAQRALGLIRAVHSSPRFFSMKRG